MEFLPFLKENSTEVDVYFRIRIKYPTVSTDLAIKTLIVIKAIGIKTVKKLARDSKFTSMQDVLNHIVVNELPTMPHKVTSNKLIVFKSLVKLKDNSTPDAVNLELFIPFIEALYIDQNKGFLASRLKDYTDSDISTLMNYEHILKNLKEFISIKDDEKSKIVLVKSLSDLEYNIMKIVINPDNSVSHYKFEKIRGESEELPF